MEDKTDLFLWANQADAIKKDLDMELFLFNKNYTPYSTKYSVYIEHSLRARLLYDLINFVSIGAGTGMSVRDFELSDSEENVVLRADLPNVGRAETLIHIIENERSDIIEFLPDEHDFKRIKGLLARFSSMSDNHAPFYVVAALQQAQAITAHKAWGFDELGFNTMRQDFAIKAPSSPHVLISDDDVFVFDQKKFETLFNYNYKKQLIADRKVEEIEKAYKLSFPDGLDLQSLVRDRKKIINKLQKVEIGAVTQEQVMEYADEMQLELMEDDAGAIIIMDGNDLDTFVNLINEDYITSEITGRRFEIKNKKLLDKEGEQDGSERVFTKTSPRTR